MLLAMRKDQLNNQTFDKYLTEMRHWWETTGHEIDCFDCNNGQLMYTTNNVKKSINKKYLNDVLEKYFEHHSPEEATKLCNYILDNRDIQVRENIKLKRKK